MKYRRINTSVCSWVIQLSHKKYCSVVETVNQHIVTAKIDDCIKRLDTPRDRFVLLLSDVAKYMTASSAALKLLYPNLFHVTCIAHLLHNCAEKVRSHFQDVDKRLKHLLWRTRPADKCSVTLEALLNRLLLAGALGYMLLNTMPPILKLVKFPWQVSMVMALLWGAQKNQWAKSRLHNR